MEIKEKTLVIVFTGVAYTALYLLNGKLDAYFSVSDGVTWVFMPSGLALLFVLLFEGLAAIGIILASAWISSQYQTSMDWSILVGSALIAGCAPWAVRQVFVDRLLLDGNLTNLTAATLLKIAVAYAVLSAVLHQLLFTWRGPMTDFVEQTGVMAIGNFSGTLIVLYCTKLALHMLVPQKTKP